MKDKADYSLYKCPYSHIEKDCGHELKGPEGYENTYGVWCACGFRGPVFSLDPNDLRLEKLKGDDSLGNDIEMKQVLAGEQAVMDNLKRLGLDT